MKKLLLNRDEVVEMGASYDKKYFLETVSENTEGYVGSRLLFRFIKKGVDNSEWFPVLEECFDTPLLVSDHRRVAGGAEGKRIPIKSGIIGFYDRLTPQQKKKTGVHKAGRVTAFTRRREKEWRRCLPFLQTISRLYHSVCPEHFRVQRREVQKVEPALRIPGTVFTTVTVNQNWSTRTHTDRGDFTEGMSCIAVLGGGYRGCGLGFPRRRVLIDMQPGDVLLMNSHEPHCNTPLIMTRPDGKRLSLVCYLREDLPLFHEKKVVDDEAFYTP